MTGTGTQNDPYIITSADDLYSMETLGGNGVCFELGADIDLNGTPYAENYQPVPFNCASFDGKGHTIRNIYINLISGNAKVFNIYPQSDHNMMIQGLKLENIRAAGENVYIFNYTSSGTAQHIHFYNCSFAFSIQRLNSSSASDYSIFAGTILRPDIELCTITMNIYEGSSMPVFRSSTITRSHIDLHIKAENAAPSSPPPHIIISSYITDSYFSGKIEGAAQTIASLSISDASTKYLNFYSRFEFERITNVYWDGIFYHSCFYDKELAGNITFARSNTSTLYEYYGLTTAQCKDPQYLEALGFMVKGVE